MENARIWPRQGRLLYNYRVCRGEASANSVATKGDRRERRLEIAMGRVNRYIWPWAARSAATTRIGRWQLW